MALDDDSGAFASDDDEVFGLVRLLLGLHEVARLVVHLDARRQECLDVLWVQNMVFVNLRAVQHELHHRGTSRARRGCTHFSQSIQTPSH